MVEIKWGGWYIMKFPYNVVVKIKVNWWKISHERGGGGYFILDKRVFVLIDSFVCRSIRTSVRV